MPASKEWEDKKRENIVIKPVEREEITYGLNEFIECLREGKEPSTNFEDNIKSFAMVCAAAAKLALEKGMYVLSEKPLAMTLAEAKDIIEFKKKYPGQKYMVDQNYRWRPHNPEESVRKNLPVKIV